MTNSPRVSVAARPTSRPSFSRTTSSAKPGHNLVPLLRSGMALIAAALAANGESRIAPLETVERGYEGLVDRLKSLGAEVETIA